jgi:hypothetical protein
MNWGERGLNDIFNIKEFVKPKMSLNRIEFLILKERADGHSGRWVDRSAGRHI